MPSHESLVTPSCSCSLLCSPPSFWGWFIANALNGGGLCCLEHLSEEVAHGPFLSQPNWMGWPSLETLTGESV